MSGGTTKDTLHTDVTMYLKDMLDLSSLSLWENKNIIQFKHVKSTFLAKND